jgi:hypothetical protein
MNELALDPILRFFCDFSISTVEVPMFFLPSFLPYFLFGFNWNHMGFFYLAIVHFPIIFHE